MLDEFFYSRAALKQSFQEFHSKKRVSAFTPDTRGEPSLIGLIQNYEALIDSAALTIKNEQYRLGPGKAHIISVDKDRTIFHFNWLDTFILYHFARSLAEVTDKGIPDSVFSYRRGKSSAAALRILKAFIANNSGPMYVIRRDISSFGEQMVHGFLIEDLQRYAEPGRALLNLFRQVCAFRQVSEDSFIENKLGLPGGHYLQLVCENLYLLALDLKMEKFEHCCYLRFGDDILFASTDLSVAQHAAGTIDEYLKDRQVSLNRQKSKNIKLVGPNDSDINQLPSEPEFIPTTNFAHLGTHVFWDSQLAIPAKKLAEFRAFMRARIKAACRPIPKGVGDSRRLNIAIKAVSNLFSDLFHGHGEDNPLRMIFQEIHNEGQLRELDRWLALVVLNSALGGGHKKGQFRIYSPGKLRQMGLPSILHLRRIHGVG